MTITVNHTLILICWAFGFCYIYNWRLTKLLTSVCCFPRHKQIEHLFLLMLIVSVQHITYPVFPVFPHLWRPRQHKKGHSSSLLLFVIHFYWNGTLEVTFWKPCLIVSINLILTFGGFYNDCLLKTQNNCWNKPWV